MNTAASRAALRGARSLAPRHEQCSICARLEPLLGDKRLSVSCKSRAQVQQRRNQHELPTYCSVYAPFTSPFNCDNVCNLQLLILYVLCKEHTISTIVNYTCKKMVNHLFTSALPAARRWVGKTSAGHSTASSIACHACSAPEDRAGQWSVKPRCRNTSSEPVHRPLNMN